MKKQIFPLLLVALMLGSCGGNSSSNASTSSSTPTPSSASSSAQDSSTTPDSSVSSVEESSADQSSVEVSSEPEDGSTQYPFRLKAALMKDEEGEPLEFDYTFSYNDSFFLEDAQLFNKDLATMSLALGMSAGKKEDVGAFFNTLDYDDVVYSPDYDIDETAETVLYTIGHKTIEGSEVIALGMNSLDYKKPWANNIIIGKTGNAAGFQVGADKVLPVLKEYIQKYSQNPVKIWMTGYSRTSAIGNIVAETLLDEEVVEEENMFFYGFETPAVVDATIKQPHLSIKNIIGKGDLITYLYPEQYGLTRAGVDIDTYVENIDEVLLAYDSRLVLPEFTPVEDMFETLPEFNQFLMNALLAEPTLDKEDPDYVPGIPTRADYVDNGYQDYVSYLIELVMSMSPEGLAYLMATVADNPFALLATDGLYTVAKDALDLDGLTYDDELLKNACNNVLAFFMNNAPVILAIAGVEMYQKNLLRAVNTHAPEVFLPLLLNYQPAEE